MKKIWEIRQNVALKAALTSRCKISSNMIVDLNFRTKNKFRISLCSKNRQNETLHF